MSAIRWTTSSSNATVYVSIPDGPRARGRVTPVKAIESWPELFHPGKRHKWHEMLHYGEPGTGYAQCVCGAVGVLRERSR